MAEPLEVDPTISKLVQLIEKHNAIRELKSRVNGNCTCIKLILEKTETSPRLK